MLQRIRKLVASPADALVLFTLFLYPFLLYRQAWKWKKLCFIAFFVLIALWQLVRSVRTKRAPRLAADTVFLPCAALALLLLLSPLLSPYGRTALDPVSDMEGSVIWGVYLLALLFLRSSYAPKRSHLYLFLLSGLIEVLLAVTNNCFVNIFGNPANASTYANYNTFGAATVMGYALNLSFLLDAESRRQLSLHGSAAFLLSVGLIFARSDNVLIGTAAVLLYLLFSRPMNARLLRRMLAALAALLLAFAAVQLLCAVPTFRTEIRTTGLLLKLSRSIPWYLSLAAAALLLFLPPRLKDREYPNLSFVLSLTVILLLALYVVGLILVNLTPVSFGKTLNGLFLISDSSGTGRGVLWRVGLTAYTKHFTLLQKLIGTGLGSFGSFIRNVPILSGIAPAAYCIPHCFLLMWLFEGGLIGLVCFCAICFLQLKSAGKGLCLNRSAALAAIAYLGAMLVTVSSPETTPIFIVFLAVCSAKEQPAPEHAPCVSVKNTDTTYNTELESAP